MGSKTSNLKPGGITDDNIRAQWRRNNLTTESEIKILTAIAEKMGFTVKYDEKTYEVTMQLNKESSSQNVSTPQQTSATQTSFVVDAKKLAEIIRPQLENVIIYTLQNNPTYVNASVDDSAHIQNNAVVMEDLEKRMDKLFVNMTERLQNVSGSFTKPKGELIVQYGNDSCFKVPDTPMDVVPNGPTGTTEKRVKPSLLKRFYNRWYEDVISSIWKAAAYTVCLCSLSCCGYLWYKNYRMENVVKEYGIIKPVLMTNRYYRSFIHSLDSTLTVTDIDDVVDRIQKNQHN